MEEKKGQSFLREEDVLFVFNNEGKRSLPVREAPWDTLSVEKGEFGKSEKRMTGRVMGGVIWGKGQKGKGQGCFKPICAADKRISWEFSSK